MTPFYFAEAGGGSIFRLDGLDPPPAGADPVTIELAAFGLTRAPLLRRAEESEAAFEHRQTETALRLRDRLTRLLRSAYYWESEPDEQRKLLQDAATAVLGGEVESESS